jgi:5'-methylthioadenosine phosphorylase
MTDPIKIAVIGGSGLYDMPGLEDKTTLSVDTPFGAPSSDIMVGTLSGKRVAFLARHGENHTYSPTTVPYRANIYALKTLGVRFILSVSACGSLREDYTPGHIVLPDQLYDNTKSERGGRTFFDDGIITHVNVADPFCTSLSDLVYAGLQKTDGTIHRGGTLVTIEGPRFSTRAESNIFRGWGCSLIGMTTSPEAYLAREAEIAYSVMAHVTDYDVWHDTEEAVSVDLVMKTVKANVTIIKQAIPHIVNDLDVDASFDSHNALKDAFTTQRPHIPQAVLERLAPIVGKYFPE